MIADLGQRTRFYNLEASRRLGEHWTATLELFSISLAFRLS